VRIHKHILGTAEFPNMNKGVVLPFDFLGYDDGSNKRN